MNTDRELTRTEEDVVFAQIMDRLDRVIKATIEYRHSDEDEFQNIKERLGIPSGVFIFDDACDTDAWTIGRIKPSIRSWVKGELTEEDCLDLRDWVFDEIIEIDWGWVFLESPMYFYYEIPEGKTKEDIDLTMEDFVKIGTRNPKKKARPCPFELKGVTPQQRRAFKKLSP